MTVTTSAPVNVSFTMRPAATTGSGMATVDFPAFHGVITEFPLAAAAGPTAITTGPDGNLWFAESQAGRLGRLTPTGIFAEFPLSAGSVPRAPAVGPDGNLWFVDNQRIERVTVTGGGLAFFPVPLSGLAAITAGDAAAGPATWRRFG